VRPVADVVGGSRVGGVAIPRVESRKRNTVVAVGRVKVAGGKEAVATGADDGSGPCLLCSPVLCCRGVKTRGRPAGSEGAVTNVRADAEAGNKLCVRRVSVLRRCVMSGVILSERCIACTSISLLF
jgi:hypothetical protein